jgi:hypothetical protein
MNIAPETTIKSYIQKMITKVKSNNKYSNLNTQNINVSNNNSNAQNNSYQVVNTKNIPNFISKNKKNQIIIDHKLLLSIKNFNKSFVLGNINENLNYNDYKDSDISKLIGFLKSYGIINREKNIKIVCHSALMKKLLNKKILSTVEKKYIFSKRKLLSDNTENKKLKYIEKNENMWSIILEHIMATENEETKSTITPNGYTIGNEMESTYIKKEILGKICITRHAFTNANIYKEQSKTYNPFTKVASKYKQYTDEDTKLSLYGILGTLDYDNSEINLNDCNNTVFVSILVRTWITALCLYLPKIDTTVQNNEFKLVVSPFIKEPGITLDNNPIPLSKQIIIIKNFLKFIRENFNEENQNENYYINAKFINTFFDNINNKLVIYAVKKTKNGSIKYIKYEISYDNNEGKKCYTSKSSVENYFGQYQKNKTANLNTFYVKNLSILPGIRKPTFTMIKTDINQNSEPLTENKIKEKFKNCTSDIKIGIIDIDEEGQKFTKEQILNFYTKYKEIFKNSNILVVCTQRSSSLGTTQHFQHLLKEVLEEQTNTNFNFKNRNKENTTQVFSQKILSPISGSKTGLRTRVYTQGLDNDKLDVKFDTVDFSATSSNEGAILCSINYDGKDLINIMNSYAVNKHNVKTSSRIQFSNIYKLKKKILSKTFFCGYLNNIDWGVAIYSENILKLFHNNPTNYPNIIQYQKPNVDFYINK